MKKLPLLWITDPWQTLDHPQDTTLRLAEEAVSLGIKNYWADFRTIRLESGTVCLDCAEVQGVFPGRLSKSFKLGEVATYEPKAFKQLHYRTDPPIDLAYLHPLQLLGFALGADKSSQIVNPVDVLLCANEKFEAAALDALMPPSLVSSQLEHLERFARANGRTVLKPLHNAMSKDVELIDTTGGRPAVELRESLKRATLDFTRPVILQRYLPGILDGEVRLWYIDGKLLAYARKRPKAGTFKIDMDQGGWLELCELNSSENKTAQSVGRHLKQLGVRLAAVDLIEGLVTDFNFTSPGLLPAMEHLLGKNLARPILKSLLPKSV